MNGWMEKIICALNASSRPLRQYLSTSPQMAKQHFPSFLLWWPSPQPLAKLCFKLHIAMASGLVPFPLRHNVMAFPHFARIKAMSEQHSISMDGWTACPLNLDYCFFSPTHFLLSFLSSSSPHLHPPRAFFLFGIFSSSSSYM